MEQFLENALMGTILILAVVFLRRALRHYLPVGTWLALWAVCLFRLLSPVTPVSPVSVYNIPRIVAQTASFDVISEADASGSYQADAPAFPTESKAAPIEEPMTAAAKTGTSLRQLLLVLYLSGVLCMSAWFIGSWLRSWLVMRKGKRLEQNGLSPCGFPIVEGVPEMSPFTFGAIRPVIVLPPGLGKSDLKFVLPHEEIHAKRRDNLWLYIMAFALVVHWWNPAVWMMSRLLRRDIEMRCDSAVLKKLGCDCRKEYAYAIISLSKKRKGMAFSSAFGYKCAEERIGAIMKHKKFSFLAIAVAFVLVFGVTTAFAAGANDDYAAASDECGETDAVTDVGIASETGEQAITVFYGEPVANVSHTTASGLENDPVGNTFEGIDSGTDGDASLVYSTSGDISVAVGSSWSRSFSTSLLFNDDHNAFKVVVSDVNGSSYKVLVTSTSGWSYSSQELTIGSTTTVTNCSGDYTYTVYILNTDKKVFTGHVQISSYYN